MLKKVIMCSFLVLIGCGGSDGGDATGGSGGSVGGGGSGSGGSGGTGGTGTPMCNASTCPAGCCLNNLCQAGNTVTACGKGGAACTTCKAFELCGSNVCAINPDSLWSVTAVSAKFDTTKPDGSAWDFGGGAPDGYACFASPPTAQTSDCTAVVSDSFNPSWNMVIKTGVKASLLKSDGWAVFVGDEDVTDDDLAGGLTEVADEQLRAGTLEFDTDAGCTLKLKFTAQ